MLCKVGRNAAGDGNWLAYYMFGDSSEKISKCKAAPQTCAVLRRAFSDGRLSMKKVMTQWLRIR